MTNFTQALHDSLTFEDATPTLKRKMLAKRRKMLEARFWYHAEKYNDAWAVGRTYTAYQHLRQLRIVQCLLDELKQEEKAL